MGAEYRKVRREGDESNREGCVFGVKVVDESTRLDWGHVTG